METRSATQIEYDPDQDAELDALDDNGVPVDTAARSEGEQEPALETASEPEAPVAPVTTAAPQTQSADFAVAPERLADASAKSTEIDAALDALAQKYEAGEIDFTAYRTQERELTRQQQTLHTEAVKASIYQDMREQSARQAWDAALAQWKAGDPANAVFESPAILPIMTAQLQQMWQDPATAGKPYLDVLNEAKASVQAQLRAVLGQPATSPAENKKPSALTATRIPPTLSSVPTARANETGGEFSHLDSLNSIELERALARMSPDQVDRYLAA